ncbi:MAG: LytR C-terminal domain-containing protein [Gemmatimonas sp.]
MTSPLTPLGYDTTPAPSRRRRALRFVIALGIVAALGTTGMWWWSGRDGSTESIATAFAGQPDTLARAPKGVRVRVLVVNASMVNGLAKRATSVLRDHGFDVVEFESGRGKKAQEKTQILTNTGHDDWSARIARVLGTGTVEDRPDNSRYVDVTVVLGLDWNPPAQAFRP